VQPLVELVELDVQLSSLSASAARATEISPEDKTSAIARADAPASKVDVVRFMGLAPTNFFSRKPAEVEPASRMR
jgi:hypothetical protein